MTKLVLFLSSLAPLGAVVSIRLAGSHLYIAIIVAAASGLMLAALPYVLRKRDSTNTQTLRGVSVQDESQAIPSYLITYIFPFIFPAIDTIYDILAYALFIIILVILALRTNLSLVNPALLVCGYHLYIVTLQGGRTITVVSKEKIPSGGTFRAANLFDNAYKLKTLM